MRCSARYRQIELNDYKEPPEPRQITIDALQIRVSICQDA
jgi:hypothetical protein